MSDVPFPMRIALIVCCSRIHDIAIMSGTFVCLLHAQSTRTEYSSQESLDVQTVFLDDVVPVAILYYVHLRGQSPQAGDRVSGDTVPATEAQARDGGSGQRRGLRPEAGVPVSGRS